MATPADPRPFQSPCPMLPLPADGPGRRRRIRNLPGWNHISCQSSGGPRVPTKLWQRNIRRCQRLQSNPSCDSSDSATTVRPWFPAPCTARIRPCRSRRRDPCWFDHRAMSRCCCFQNQTLFWVHPRRMPTREPPGRDQNQRVSR